MDTLWIVVLAAVVMLAAFGGVLWYILTHPINKSR